jgi:hypothetical protein
LEVAPVFTFLISAATHPVWPGAPEWLSTRVLACAAAAVGLAILSLLLKGMQKVITLLMAFAIVLGGVWLVQDAWLAKEQILPPELAAELNGIADRALANPDARAAWVSVQAEWDRLSKEAKARLSAGGDDARATVAKRIDAKATELRKQGKKAAAEELNRMREKVAPAG